MKSNIDPILAKDQLQGLQSSLAQWGSRAWMASMFWVLTKEQRVYDGQDATRLVPFYLNPIQADIEEKLVKNNIIGKPRQTGFTTYLSLRRLFLPSIVDGGVGSLLISQNGDMVAEHFRIIQRAYKYIGVVNPNDDEQNALSISLKANLLHTKYSNKKELVFDYLDSKVRVASAEVEESAQGLTLHAILADEYARWPKNPEATLANVRGALISSGTLDKSSTANGMIGPYWQDVMRALNSPETSDAKLHYYSWYWDPEYTKKNMSEDELDELEKDLTADELKIIAKMHSELQCVAYV